MVSKDYRDGSSARASHAPVGCSDDTDSWARVSLDPTEPMDGEYVSSANSRVAADLLPLFPHPNSVALQWLKMGVACSASLHRASALRQPLDPSQQLDGRSPFPPFVCLPFVLSFPHHHFGIDRLVHRLDHRYCHGHRHHSGLLLLLETVWVYSVTLLLLRARSLCHGSLGLSLLVDLNSSAVLRSAVDLSSVRHVFTNLRSRSRMLFVATNLLLGS